MRIDKVVLRAALSTLAAILVLIGVMILALSFLYPVTMMNITYDLGMDGSSVRCAERAYVQSGKDVYFIAYATDVAIGADDHAAIERCGEQLIADEEFSAYCASRNAANAEKADADKASGSYEQYVYGKICLAKYRQGDKTGAVARAFELTGGAFAENNALAAVGIIALSEGDAVTAASVKEKMNEIDKATLTDADQEYFDKVFAVLSNG